MPMVATPPSVCTYSWLFAYLLSSGVVVIVASLGALVERSRHNASACLFASDQDGKFGSHGRFALRKIREADRFFQCRRVRAAGDDADLLRAVDDRVSVAADAAVDHLESD